MIIFHKSFNSMLKAQLLAAYRPFMSFTMCDIAVSMAHDA